MSNENPMEDFWGCTLTKGKKEYSWNPIETEEDVEHKLQVTTACLGPKAKDGERNLVEVTTEDEQGKQTTCSIVSLRVGQKECFHLELGFNNPTKFTLREGSGPVSLCGVHLQAGPIDFSDVEGEEESDVSGDEDIPNLVEIINAKKGDVKKLGKRPLEDDKTNKPVQKKKKPEPVLEPESDDEEGEEDEEENEEESGDEDESGDEEMPSLLDGEAEEDDDEESEDEDEPEEGDSLDEEDEEDEDEDSEGEEETPAKPQKKPLTNGHTPKNKKEQKTPAKTPTNKSSKTPQKTPAKKTTEEIKAMLVKSPNLPKKFDKFENYMKNNMKVTDKKTLKDVWDYVEKNRK